VEGNLYLSSITIYPFELEWLSQSGYVQRFPEIDKAAWFSAKLAIQKIKNGQIGFIY